ncbi:MAG: DUF1552 domain-containing protein [Gammaproteobacteria bacterium]
MKKYHNHRRTGHHAADMQRRDFLKFLGKAGLSLPVIRASVLGAGALLGQYAQAAGLASRRVIFVFVPGGTPQQSARSYTPTANLTLNRCSAPLEAVKRECVFFSGVEIVGGGGHGLTQRVLGAFADGVRGTLDLALGEVVGAISPVSSLRLGVRTRGLEPISARGYSQVTDYQDNPETVFNRLFGGNIDVSQIGIRRDRKVLEMNQIALDQIKSKLGSYALDRLQQHESAIAKLQADINNVDINNVDINNESTSIIPQRLTFNPGGLSTEQADSKFTSLFALQAENAVLALQTNITRIVTIQLGTHQSDFSGTGMEGDYHGAIHGGSLERYQTYRAYFTERVAYLINRLANTTDPATGERMLDSTLVVQVTDMGDGNAHTGSDAPFMFAGGGSAVNRGNVISAPNHHRLLDTVAEYMGAYGTIGAYDANGPIRGIVG